MFKSQMQRNLIFVAVSFISFSGYARSVLACGGATATIADDPKPFALKTEKGPGDVTPRFDKTGSVYVVARIGRDVMKMTDNDALKEMRAQIDKTSANVSRDARLWCGEHA